jgi:flagellar hook-basal body complex protein FliE
MRDITREDFINHPSLNIRVVKDNDIPFMFISDIFSRIKGIKMRKMKLVAGAAQVEITPLKSMFLAGYPHVERDSTGVHDPLLSSALYLADGVTEVMFIGNDIIFIPKSLAMSIRKEIQQATGIPAANIMITATHTHSGPRTTDSLCNQADVAVSNTDPDYVQFMGTRIVDAAIKAYNSAAPATLGLAVADGTGVGTNRRDPDGPSDLDVPVLLVRSVNTEKNIAAMLVCCMHPTVLHEDSTLVSGDFPGMTRQYLQNNVLGVNCPVVYHTGPEGNQSPRHVTKANTFEEATRLGEILGRAAEKVIAEIELTDNVTLAASQDFIELVPKVFVSVAKAEEQLKAAVDKLASLRSAGAPARKVRTAECDWFGAEETLTLAQAAQDGRLAESRKSVMPAEVQIFTLGKWKFVAWPGEVFVEYDLMIKEQSANTYLIGQANGELQGYIVTPEAAAEGGYEASNGLFAPESGKLLVEKTLKTLSGKIE